MSLPEFAPADPGGVEGPDPTAAFEAARPRLMRVAYRMLGSVAEAEDVVQDAWLRWRAADRTAVRDPAGFLVRTVTRLCLDQLKSARHRREAYTGPWLPEPLLGADAGDALHLAPAPDQADGTAETVTLALMVALERLSPLERAAFLLHDVFGMPFAAVAGAVGSSEAACRKLASRARSHLRAARPRFSVPSDRAAAITQAFFAASRDGDATALSALLAEDTVAITDGGGRILAAINPIRGRDKVARFFLGLARRAGRVRPPLLYRGPIDGLPGFVTREPCGALQTTALQIEGGRIAAIYITRNPDKLRAVARALAPDQLKPGMT